MLCVDEKTTIQAVAPGSDVASLPPQGRPSGIAQAVADDDPLGAARATLVGQVQSLIQSEAAFAREWVEATEAAMTSVDRLGFYLRLKTAERMKGTRINFLREVRTAQETRTVLLEMVRQAKTQA